MKILVTGGAGFVGSHTVDALLKEDHEVIVVDNLTTGHKENINKDAIFYNLDISNPDLENMMKKEKPDKIYHLAAQVNVVKSVRDPLYDLNQNLGGSLNLLELCVKYGVNKVIYSSTGGAVYGDPAKEDLPVAEEYPLKPLSPYGVHKHTVEHYLYLYHVNYGLKYTVLRYPNVYGPRQDPHGEAGVVAIFSIKLLDGKRPTIFGDGSKTRDYVYVEDVVRGNLTVLNEGDGETFNLGWGKGIRDDEIFQAVKEATGSDLEPILVEKRTGEVEHISLCAKKIEHMTGWKPQVALKDGVKKSVEFYRTNPPWITRF